MKRAEPTGGGTPTPPATGWKPKKYPACQQQVSEGNSSRPETPTARRRRDGWDPLTLARLLAHAFRRAFAAIRACALPLGFRRQNLDPARRALLNASASAAAPTIAP
ncbi:MAG: hypothetical protein MZV64_16840 [Ignavibacteriales bacterium]|nr:hypothetical protein [Ignavibacteriales bacterium]